MNIIIQTAKRFLDEHSLEFCETLNSFTIKNKLKSYRRHIHEATDDNYKRDLMKAITIEEQLHQYPLQSLIEDNIPEEWATSWDIADSVGPGQIRVSLWADTYDTNRQDLINPKTHFVTMNKHIDFIFSHIEKNNLPSSPDWIGTIWCNMNATKISRYGQRVANYYKALQLDN